VRACVLECVCIEMEKERKKNQEHTGRGGGAARSAGGGAVWTRGRRSTGGGRRGGGVRVGEAGGVGRAGLRRREEAVARGGAAAAAARDKISAASRRSPLQIENLSKSPPPVPYTESAFPGADGGVIRPCKLISSRVTSLPAPTNLFVGAGEATTRSYK
jgi:hypothetical protein